MARKTKEIFCGNLKIGNNNPIVIQSMTNTKTENIKETVQQILRLEKAGCELIRVAIPTKEAADAIKNIKEQINIPIVADIHFDYRLAIASIEAGADGVRINPGNIGSKENIKKVIDFAKKRKNFKIRLGVNGGSLEKDLLLKYKKPTADALVESCLRHIKFFEENDFTNIVLSLKSSNIKTSIEAYEKISQKTNYPLHIGITEAGSQTIGTIRSSIGLGYLLIKGIGDTMRVSLTGDPEEEIFVAKEMLRSLEIRKEGITFISCPTCGRTNIGLEKIVKQVEEKLKYSKKTLQVAIMGCAVNGPGEAREADIGIAGGKDEGIIFKKGKVLKKVKSDELVKTLIEEIEKM